MNSIFEVLYCRRPVLNYVCPPVCEVLFSGSGFPVIVLGDFSSFAAPGGVRFGGFGGFRLSWNRYVGAICYNIYRADTDDPNAPLILVSECFTGTDIPLPPGCYRVSAITPDGETALSPAVCYFDIPMIPPEVTTEAASDILSTSATLNGTINAIGQASTAQFEWGITLAYGNFTPLQNTGATFNDVPYSAVITGLNPNSPYHYRAIGSNGSGIGEGADMTFQTLASGGGGFTVIGDYYSFEDSMISVISGRELFPYGTTGFAPGQVAVGMFSSNTDSSSGAISDGTSGLTYPGNGITVSTWFKIGAISGNVIQMSLMEASWVPDDFSNNGGFIGIRYDKTSNEFTAVLFDDVAAINTISIVVPNTYGSGWIFVVAWYDPADLRLRIQFNNGPVFTSVDTLIVASYPTGIGDLSMAQANADIFFGGGSFYWQFDEMFVHFGVLDADQRDYVWNGGIGRTYPFL